MKPDALRVMELHRQAGDALVLASASLDLYVEPIGRLLGFDAVVSTRVAWTPDGRIAGALDGDNLRGPAKLVAVRELLSRKFPNAEDLVAYSDHESDVSLLAAAGTAVVVDPTRKMREEARRRGWPVVDWSGTGWPDGGRWIMPPGPSAGRPESWQELALLLNRDRAIHGRG
ncbi:HAD family hydrolase [Pseudoroseomonas wenyumeiae]